MPNTKSAAKRHRQSEKRRLASRAVRSAVKTQIRQVHTVLGTGDMTKVGAEQRAAAKKLDQAAAKGVIHKNKASRLKSRLARALKAAGAKGA